MEKIDLAWVAGFFEGEGTVRINKATKRNLGNLVSSITNTDKEIIYWLHSRWGGYNKIQKTKGNRKTAYVWVLSSRMAMSFLKQILPFIKRSIVRKKISLAIEFQEQKRINNHVTDEYRQEQFSYYLQMKDLNVRGLK